MLSGTSVAARATYASTNSSPTVVQSSLRGIAVSGSDATAAMCAAICSSAGGTICDGPTYTLYPLSWGGLWDAVTTTPATQSRWRMPNATRGVGT